MDLATEAHSQTTLIRAESAGSHSGRRTNWWTLPADMLGESVRRIRVLAWLYALAYFLAGMFPALFDADDRARMFAESSTWAPAAASVAGGIVVALFPYIIVLIMVYVGSRVVYRLGTAVREARELGSYRLKERLGAGGMGEVWRAEHRMLARPAAIKLIRPEVLGARDADSRDLMVHRFEREAQATALMRSAHTVELYDFGVTDEGTFYYVMELLDGLDLANLVRRAGPIPPERAVHFLRQICDSLAEAHEAGLIHRDIKPANIYACHHGRILDFVKVLDFGLVKHGGKPDEVVDDLTADRVAGGTPAFMAPEQALGEPGVDGRSDLYAVGCVAYWLLTGTVVFEGKTAMETIVMHVNQEPEPPSHRSGLSIPPDLEAIVLACLAKSPDARPQTADELAARLDSVTLRTEWTPVMAREWWRTHRSPNPVEFPAPLINREQAEGDSPGTKRR